jgi:hypothetical protein
MMSAISQFKVKSMRDWFKPDTAADGINLLTKIL